MKSDFPRTAGQSAARLIRQRILTGALEPGAMLNQNELALQLGMSRIPIRDALRSLSAEGLVHLRAHATASVATLSLTDLEELYEIRLALEPRLCRLALRSLTSDDTDAMATILSELEHADDAETWLPLNNAFHEALYGKSLRPRSIQIINRTRQATDRYIRIYHRFDPQTVEVEHRLIYDAAVAGHGRRLESLVAAHLADGYETMMEYVADHERDADSVEDRMNGWRENQKGTDR